MLPQRPVLAQSNTLDPRRKSPTSLNGPRGQRAKGSCLRAKRPPKRGGSPPPAAASSKNGRVPAVAQRRDGRQARSANVATAAAKDNGGRAKARERARPPSRDAPRPPTKMAAATKHARTTSPLPRCNGGRWRRWRPQARTRMGTAPLSAQNGRRLRGQCPRRCDPAHNWSEKGVCSQRDCSRRSRGATTPPLRRRSHRGPQAASETIFDGLAGGTTPPYAPKTGGRPRSPPRSGGIERPPWLPVTLRAQQATPSVTPRSTCVLPGPQSSIDRHCAPCATCGALSAVHGGRPIEGVAGGVHRKSASDQ